MRATKAYTPDAHSKYYRDAIKYPYRASFVFISSFIRVGMINNHEYETRVATSKVRTAVRGMLQGKSSRDVQLGLANVAAESFDFGLPELLGLPVDSKAVALLSSEKKADVIQKAEQVKQLIADLDPEQVEMAVESAYTKLFVGEPRKVALSKEARVLASIVLALMLMGIFPVAAKAALPTVTPSPSLTTTPSEAKPSMTQTPLSMDEDADLVPTPTVFISPTRTPTSTPTPVVPEVAAVPEILVDWAVVLQDQTNLRPDPSTNNTPVYQADKGEKFELTNETKQVGSHVWFEVYIVKDLVSDENSKKAWVRGDLITVQNLPKPETGIGGSVIPTSTVEVTATSTITGTESLVELSKDQELIHRMLPDNFKEFYQSKGGVVEWNEAHKMYTVTMPVGDDEKTYLLIPATSAEKVTADFDVSNDQVDLENGLYYFSEKGTVSQTFTTNAGTVVTQSFHFGVAPTFPGGSGQSLWSGEFSPTDAEVVIGESFRKNPEQIIDLFRKMMGFGEDESFEFYFVLSGQDMSQYNSNPDLTVPRGADTLFSGGNDFKSAFLRLQDKRYVGIYYTSDVDGVNYLIDTSDVELGKKFFGYGYINRALDRVITNSPFRPEAEVKKFLDLEYTDTFVGGLLEEKYAMEDKISEQTVAVQVSEEYLDAYISQLQKQSSN